MPSIGDAWAIIKKVDRLLDLEEKQSKAIAGLQDQIDALTDRVTRLEAREDIVVAEAKGAAGVAAAGAMAELARRIGVLEGSRSVSGATPRQRRIKAPDSDQVTVPSPGAADRASVENMIGRYIGRGTKIMAESSPYGTSFNEAQLDPTHPVVGVMFVPGAASPVRLVLTAQDRSGSIHAPGAPPPVTILGISMQVDAALEIFSKIRELARTMGWPLPREDEDQT